MASGFATAGANAVINATLRNTALQVANAYLALHVGAPGVGGASNEVVGNGYARLTVAYDAPAAGVTANSAAMLFTASGGNWGSVDYVSIWDALSGGNCLYCGAMTAAKTINDGDSLNFAIGAVDVTATEWAGS